MFSVLSLAALDELFRCCSKYSEMKWKKVFSLSSSLLVLYAFKIAFNFACYPLIKKKEKKKLELDGRALTMPPTTMERAPKKLILKCEKRIAQSYTNRPLNARALYRPLPCSLCCCFWHFQIPAFFSNARKFQHRNFRMHVREIFRRSPCSFFFCFFGCFECRQIHKCVSVCARCTQRPIELSLLCDRNRRCRSCTHETTRLSVKPLVHMNIYDEANGKDEQ